MKLLIGPNFLKSYRRLSYKPWYAFAEFIDNSTQSLSNVKKDLLPQLKKEGKILEVFIEANNKKITIEDNSIGMDIDDIKRALTIAEPPVISNGRSKFGMGLKTAAFWFGNTWEIKTKKFNCNYEIVVKVNLDNIIQGFAEAEKIQDVAEKDTYLETLIPQEITENVSPELHYTIITITDLNRKFTDKTNETTKEYLRSIYRYDLMFGMLVLKYNGDILSWSKDEFKARLRKDTLGTPYYKEFEFTINDKSVKGWAGVLSSGSRKDAGFSLLQNKRVIQGWPAGYKPKLLFGDISGGINNMTNQRLVGELDLDGFPVSHTKDEILFDSEEEEELDYKLNEYLIDFKRIAESSKLDLEENSPIDFEPIVKGLLSQLNDTTFRAYVNEYPVLDHEEIVATNKIILQKALEESIDSNYTATVGDLKVNLLINSESSPYDPYLIIDPVNKPNVVFIILNRNHPHWKELTDHYSISRFIKDCIYDGIAEWKAFHTVQRLEPDTIKSIKDLYMRFTMNLD